MDRTDFWSLWEKARVGCFKRTASKHVYYLGWNRSPAHVGCMRQVLGPGALGRPRGIRWRGRWEGVSRWGTQVNPWLIHFNVWQNPLQYCKVISLQLIIIKKIVKKKKKTQGVSRFSRDSAPLTKRPNVTLHSSLSLTLVQALNFLLRQEMHVLILPPAKNWHNRRESRTAGHLC